MSQFYSTLRSLFLRNEKVSSLSLGGLMLLSLVAMGIFSLGTLNDKAVKGYMLTKLENEAQKLVSDGEITEMLNLKARSMDAIEAQVSYMVKPEREAIVYVLPVSVVAQNTGEKVFE